jgi:hemolysin III
VIPDRPRLRGVFHQWSCFVAAAAGVALVLSVHGTRARVATAIFAASVVSMFGASALYHRVTWSPARRRWMRRLDHAMIYVLIAGTYTPFCLLALDGAWRVTVLSAAWIGATVAIAIKLLWVDAPKWLSVVFAITLGWMGVVALPQFVRPIGLAGALLLVAGGLFYTVGAFVYATRKPDPRPLVFGYHEIFHVLVVAAVACQYAAVAVLVL